MAIFNSYVKLPEGTSSFYIGVQPIVDRGRLGRPGDDRRVPRPCGVRQYELLQWWTAGQWWTNSNGEELEPSDDFNLVGIMLESWLPDVAAFALWGLIFPRGCSRRKLCDLGRCVQLFHRARDVRLLGKRLEWQSEVKAAISLKQEVITCCMLHAIWDR